MHKIVYIGSFTGKQGGVTVKNNAIYNELRKKSDDIDKVDLAKIKAGNISVALKLILSLLGKDNILIIGASAKPRRIITKVLYYLNRRTLRKATLIVMGGVFADDLKNDYSYREWAREYKYVLVETQRMINDLLLLEYANVDLLPNCRPRPNIEIKVKKNINEPLRCVFFSMISPEKGVDLILDVAKNKKNVLFDFWGEIRSDYDAEFNLAIRDLENCRYNGVFKGKDDDVYRMLNNYDVILLPTRWIGEGVPGALVEAKIAGIPAIVSDWAHNRFIIQHMDTGIVMDSNKSEVLASSIDLINSDRQLLMRLKENALESSKKYHFEEYIELIKQMII